MNRKGRTGCQRLAVPDVDERPAIWTHSPGACSQCCKSNWMAAVPGSVWSCILLRTRHGRVKN